MTAQHTEENPPYLDDEERDLIESFNKALKKGTIKRVSNFEARKKELERMAREDLATKKAS